MLALITHYVKGDPHHGIPFPYVPVLLISILMCGGLSIMLYGLLGGFHQNPTNTTLKDNDKET
jgi:hypothetical protein